MASRRELIGALSALIRVIDISDEIDTVRAGSVLHHASELVHHAERGLIEQVPWTPFEPRSSHPPSKVQIAASMRRHQCSEAEVLALYAEQMGKLFVNSRYQVLVRDLDEAMVYLSIKRIDQLPIHDWRDLQRCKDELVGPECEGVELYPATSRVLDSSNQYHLWVMRDPTVRLPLGFGQGGSTDPGAADAVGAGQRAFEQ